MHTVTNLVPAPGVLFAFDERACAVTHTLNDTWHYLVEGRAWAWQSVHVTGSIKSLDDAEVAYVAEFMDDELVINDLKSLKNTIYEADSPSCGASEAESVDLPSGRALRKIVSRSWSDALKLNRTNLDYALRTIRYAHEEGFPPASLEASGDIREVATRHTPWWVASRYRTPKAIALVATVAAHHLGMRLDFSFGMSHQTKRASFWSSTFEGDAGRGSEVLVIGRV